MSKKVVICGGGIAGASMAAALANSEYEVLLIEKEHESLGKYSGGETLRSETCKSFDRLGVLKEILKYSHSIKRGDRRELYHVAKGMLGYFRYDAFAPEYPVVHTHHNNIVKGIHDHIDSLKASNLERKFGCEVVGIGEYKVGRRKIVYKERTSGEVRAIEADLVIGADGSKSIVRRSLDIPTQERDLGIAYLMFYIKRLSGFEYGRFTVGSHGFIGIFPSSENTLRLAVEVKISELGNWAKLDNEKLKQKWIDRDPALKGAELVKRGLPFHVIMRLSTSYISKGACIIGDAAHVPPPILGMGISLVLNDVLALQKVLLEPVEEPFSFGNLKRFEEIAAPYNIKWVETNYRLYLWLNAMCMDAEKFYDIPIEELMQMGFNPVDKASGLSI